MNFAKERHKHTQGDLLLFHRSLGKKNLICTRESNAQWQNAFHV